MVCPSDLLFILLLVIVAVQLLLVFRLRRWPNDIKNKKRSRLPSVSVVVCSHNDEAELKKNLPFLLNQTYPIMEVIVVDDHSDDNTAEWLASVLSTKLRVITLRNNKMPGKRWALAAGIKAARHDWIVLTDADCRVSGNRWMESLAGYLTDEHIGYVGYGPYRKMPGLFNKLVRFDTAQIASLYLSMAASGTPYMGVGRNMGWHRSVFPSLVNALEHLPTASGDDDLVLQHLRSQGKILAIADPATFVYSEPKMDWMAWLRQKSRHHTTGWKYHWKDRLGLGAWQISRWLFYPVWLAGILLGVHSWLCAGVFILRSVFVWGWMTLRFNKLMEKDLIGYTPLLEIIHTFVLPIFSLLSLGKTTKPWK